MTSAKTFKDFCECLCKCAEKLGEEVKKDITDSEELILKSETIDVKLPLQKVKIYHYNAILQLMNEMKINVKKITYHQGLIKKLENTRRLSGEELKNYSSMQSRSLDDLTTIDQVTKRQKRRVSSEMSIYSLNTWEAYLERKEEELGDVDTSEIKANVPKRNKTRLKRNKNKFISSTFNDLLDTENIEEIDIGNDYIQEEDEGKEDRLEGEIEDDGIKAEKNEFEDNSGNYKLNSVTLENKISETEDDSNSLESNLDENLKNDTKPKIIDVIYKTKENA